MYKQLIAKVFVLLTVFLGTIISVNAANIKDLNRNDIVIGNTVFKSGTWVSAARAATAGSLYTKNTGRTDVKTYLYVNPAVIYTYDLDTESYKLLNSSEIAQLEVEMNIYYKNNIVINNTYESWYESEIDEETGEEIITGGNEVFYFFNYNEFATININDDKVKLDYQNKTITCPYNYVFDFEIIFEEDDPNINESYTYEYKGICGLSDFAFESKIWHDLEPINIENIELVNSNSYPEFINQEKVEHTVYDNGNYFNVDINILERLENFSLDEFSYIGENNYIVFDIKFNENNICDHYDIIGEEYTIGMNYICINDNTMRVYLSLYDYYIGGHYSENFIIVDRVHNTYNEIRFYIDGSNIDDTISYVWGEEVDSAGRQYLYLVDSNGEKVSGYAYITYDNTDYEVEIFIDEEGYLLVPDLVTINSVFRSEEGEY